MVAPASLSDSRTSLGVTQRVNHKPESATWGQRPALMAFHKLIHERVRDGARRFTITTVGER